MGFFSKIAKVTKSVVRSPITKVAAGGLAIAFPPAGIPAVAGLAIANTTLDRVDQAQAAAKALRLAKAGKKREANAVLRNNKRQRAALAKKLVLSRKLARAGDVGAKRAVSAFRLAAAAKAERRANKKDKRALANARKQKAIAAKAIKAIKRRYDVGQAVRARLALTRQGIVVRKG